MTEQNLILVTKASGEVEPFEVYKLENSLLNAGADEETVSEIVSDVQSWMSPGVSTKKIYRRAFDLLKRKRHTSALKYKLKQAIFELGPSGYPFEYLVAEIYKRNNYKTEVGKIIEGNCVNHEVDVIAENKNEKLLIECKYSENQGKQVSIQVPLYFYARTLDIIRKLKHSERYKNYEFKPYVVTNTRFSSDSITYGKCIGMELISWDYPQRNSLKELVEKENIWPITILTKLTKKEKNIIMQEGIVTCSQLLENINILNSLKLKKRKYKVLLKEVNDILS